MDCCSGHGFLCGVGHEVKGWGAALQAAGTTVLVTGTERGCVDALSTFVSIFLSFAAAPHP